MLTPGSLPNYPVASDATGTLTTQQHVASHATQSLATHVASYAVNETTYNVPFTYSSPTQTAKATSTYVHAATVPTTEREALLDFFHEHKALPHEHQMLRTAFMFPAASMPPSEMASMPLSETAFMPQFCETAFMPQFCETAFMPQMLTTTSTPLSETASMPLGCYLDARRHPTGARYSFSAATLPTTEHEALTNDFRDAIRAATTTSQHAATVPRSAEYAHAHAATVRQLHEELLPFAPPDENTIVTTYVVEMGRTRNCNDVLREACKVKRRRKCKRERRHFRVHEDTARLKTHDTYPPVPPLHRLVPYLTSVTIETLPDTTADAAPFGLAQLS